MTKSSLRLRIFAGPNGSGKSTIINAVRKYRVKEIPVDFGIYINADDIAYLLWNKGVNFDAFEIKVKDNEFVDIVLQSGLIGKKFTEMEFRESYTIHANKLTLIKKDKADRVAQIIADYLRKKLLQERKKFSFETVFSHSSKLEIMKQAIEAGYKVYLYFVSTEDPEINKFRVKKVRVAVGGHDVPEDKIVSRYYRSLELLYEASQLTYQTYFFDNSKDGEEFKLFAHFKNINDSKTWDEIDKEKVPRWFVNYYSNKIKHQ